MTSDPSDENPTIPGAPLDGENPTIPSLTPHGADAGAPVPPMGLDANAYVGKVLGGCRLDGLIGRGAMGAVFKARQVKLERDVAVKIIRPEQMSDPRKLKRFEIEARTVGKFNSQHVVMVHDVGFEQGVHFLVMEYVRGTNLRAHVKKLPGGRLPTEAALPLLRQAVQGLEEARRLGIVHRDIKPDNLMLTDQGILKIADFGIAKPAEDDLNLTITQELVGTPLYMSPEQCQSATDIDFRSDMYSLGATFFYLLTGIPPFRASSVYELIHTKTNLENLCLWKARPDLEEGHPLSRVIARMTANDRADRYATYDDLLADLAQVASDTAKQAQPAPKASSRLAAVAVLVLLVGGAGAAYATGAWSPGGGGGGGGVLATDDAAVRTGLERCRQRLGADGPSAALRADVERLPATPATDAERTRLLADVDAGLAAAARFAAIARPPKPALPFDDVAAHLDAVAAASSPMPDEARPELRQWQQARAAAVADRAGLGAAARAELLAAFTGWQDGLGKAGGDSVQLAALGEQLARIEAGRQRLLTALPEQRADLESSLTEEMLAEARRRLANPTMTTPLADIGPALTDIATELAATGPSESLLTRAKGLQPADAAQVETHKRLLDALGTADTCKAQANMLPQPVRPKPPFDDVETYFAELDRALAPLQRDGALPAWATALRAELRAEPERQAACGEACARLWAEWQEKRRTGAPTSELEADQRALQAAVAKAAALFPALREPLARLAPLAELDAAMTAVRGERVLAEWDDALLAATTRLEAIDMLGEWRERAKDLAAAGEQLRAGLAALPAGSDASTRLAKFAAGCDRWLAADKRYEQAASHLGAGSLTQCLAALPDDAAKEGKDDFAQLRKVVDDARQAFATIEATLDLAAATQALTAASEKAAAMPLLPATAVQRLRSWQEGLQGLRAAASGMTPIPAGTARNSSVRLPAFFVAATECSRGAWRRFLADVRAAARGDDDEQRFAAVAARLQGCGLDANGLAVLLDSDRRGDDNEPVDRVTWQQAMAFCRWHGRDLPRGEEWTLAAFGDGGAYRFPWGQEWSDDEAKRNPHTAFAMAVDAGGLSWRSADGAKLHHLGGNVAEWLAADPAERSANVAGGRYNKSGRAAAEDAAAGKFETRFKDDPLGGIGFRAILRPRDFAALAWPQ